MILEGFKGFQRCIKGHSIAILRAFNRPKVEFEHYISVAQEGVYS